MIGASGLGPLGGPASLAPRLAAGYETYRRMRRDPTIALARALAVAPVVAGKWTVQADADVPEEVRGWIDKQFLTVREPLLETILKHGYVDFGHQGFELIWGLDADGRQCVVRFKPLLPDITEILIDGHGGLAGLRQQDVELTGTSAMLVSFGGEGSNLYGEPLLENVREAWNDWRKANEVAARYDRKIAGAYLLLHYPSFGQGIDQNGAKLDNVYLAQRILDKLEAASGVAIGDVPSELAPGQDPNQTAWRLEVQGSAGGQQQGFVDRLRYLDSLKVRGMLLPERAILEGQHGTLAESQSQGDLALLAGRVGPPPPHPRDQPPGGRSRVGGQLGSRLSRQGPPGGRALVGRQPGLFASVGDPSPRRPQGLRRSLPPRRLARDLRRRRVAADQGILRRAVRPVSDPLRGRATSARGVGDVRGCGPLSGTRHHRACPGGAMIGR